MSPRVVAQRIGGGAGRPLLSDGDESPIARWERILAERRPVYEDVADATFDTSGPLDRVVAAIVAWADPTASPSEGSA